MTTEREKIEEMVKAGKITVAQAALLYGAITKADARRQVSVENNPMNFSFSTTQKKSWKLLAAIICIFLAGLLFVKSEPPQPSIQTLREERDPFRPQSSYEKMLESAENGSRAAPAAFTGTFLLFLIAFVPFIVVVYIISVRLHFLDAEKRAEQAKKIELESLRDSYRALLGGEETTRSSYTGDDLYSSYLRTALLRLDEELANSLISFSTASAKFDTLAATFLGSIARFPRGLEK